MVCDGGAPLKIIVPIPNRKGAQEIDASRVEERIAYLRRKREETDKKFEEFAKKLDEFLKNREEQ